MDETEADSANSVKDKAVMGGTAVQTFRRPRSWRSGAATGDCAAWSHAAPTRARASTSTTARVGAALVAVSCSLAIARDHQRIGVAAGLAVIAMIPAALVDVREHRLPNRLVLAAGIVFLVAAVAEASIAAIPSTGAGAGDLVVGAATMAGPLLILHLVWPEAMGFGDVKAAIVLGAALGSVHPQLPLVALLFASGATAIVGLTTRRRALPFGPGLVAGAALALAVGGPTVGALT